MFLPAWPRMDGNMSSLRCGGTGVANVTRTNNSMTQYQFKKLTMKHLFRMFFLSLGMKGREFMASRSLSGHPRPCRVRASGSRPQIPQHGALELCRFPLVIVTLSRARAFLDAGYKSICLVDQRDLPQLAKLPWMMCVGLALCVGCTSTFPPKPDLAKAYYERGIVKMVAEQDYPGAVESFNRAIQFNPDDPTNYVSRALAYKRIGDMKKARNDMDRAISLNKELAPLLRHALE